MKRLRGLEFFRDAPASVRWEIGRAILFMFFRTFHRVAHYGCENIPASGPVLLVANHVSYYDPMLVGMGSRRRVRFMTWDAVFRVPLLGWLVRQYGAFPVKPEKAGKSSLSEALATLKRGEALGIFPEGGRSFDGQIARVKPGAAWLAVRARATIVPATVVGMFDVWPRQHLLPRLRGRIVVKYHPPIVLDEATCAAHEDDKAFQAELMARVMDVVRSGLR